MSVTSDRVGVTTLGEVVEAGAPLVTIVPDGNDLVIEALVLNRDAGFVHVGDRVVIKLEAFPFTRYGYLEGVVERISADAITDEQRGLVFPARVRITGSRLRDVTLRRLIAREGNATAEASGDVSMRANSDASVRAGVPRASSSHASRAQTQSGFSVARLPISPGMSAQVEIITGRRTVLDYLLSPIARATSEAGRER